MRTLQGTIVSNKMMRTVVVRVDRLRQHPKYRKFYRVSQKYKADTDDARQFQPGDIVRIQESRPLSREKRWRVLDIVKRVLVPGDVPENGSEALRDTAKDADEKNS